jgi:hypothetical protein
VRNDLGGVACHDHSRAASVGSPDARVGDASFEGGSVGDAAIEAASPPFTMQGVYRCCSPDAGTDCCVGASQGTCFPYGGVTGQCSEEGEIFDAKDVCSTCCGQLKHVHVSAPGDESPPVVDGLPEGCDPGPLLSYFLCIACGDGICGKGENVCTCPEDCPPLSH